MDTELPPADGQLPLSPLELPAVDEVLAAALRAQGEAGMRALGLLRDAARMLSGVGLERPAEVAEPCLRGAAAALLSLPGAPVTVGLKAAAAALLDAVDALADLPASAAPPAQEPATVAGSDEGAQAGRATGAERTPAAATAPEPGPSAGGGLAGPADEPAGGGANAGPSAGAVQRVRDAAEGLRGQLKRPGGFHRARAAGIAVRLMGVELGGAQERALEVWGDVYGKTSGTLHGAGADLARAAALYGEALAAARELLVPLPGRAARVLELAALADPGEVQARELAGWADPRATAYFFRSGLARCAGRVRRAPAARRRGSGAWPAAPFLEQGGFARRLAARWVRTLPAGSRDRDWLVAAETLLTDAVDAEHAGQLALQAVLERARRPGSRCGWPRARARRRARRGPGRSGAGPLLARTVLDLAADAAAGLPLAERLRAWPRIEQADPHLHARLLAAHLAAHPPHAAHPDTAAGPDAPAPVDEARQWWDRAVEATVRLLTGRPPPEGARLAGLVMNGCPAERAKAFSGGPGRRSAPRPRTPRWNRPCPRAPSGSTARRSRSRPGCGCGTGPRSCPRRCWTGSARCSPRCAGCARPARPTRAPPSSLCRSSTPSRSPRRICWSWPPRRARSKPPPRWPAPRTPAPTGTRSGCTASSRPTRPPGPPTSPPCWPPCAGRSSPRSTSPPSRAPYTAPAPCRPASPGGARRPRAAPHPADLRARPTRSRRRPFADQALFALLALVWRTGADLAGDLTSALDRLHALAEPLTRPAAPPHPSDSPADAAAECGLAPDLPGSDPAVRALDCLLEYAAARAPAGTALPDDVLGLVAGALAARAGDEAVAPAIGVHLLLLHRHAGRFAAAHPELYDLTPGRATPAAAWLRRGRHDPLLLAALGRTRSSMWCGSPAQRRPAPRSRPAHRYGPGVLAQAPAAN
ncbi:hypothetical protein [Streptomyces murinus]|uniref:hypothetical protein n=1 Tax=Streptomyces murinus TaxID=33900 RepID=UPI003825C885